MHRRCFFVERKIPFLPICFHNPFSVGEYFPQRGFFSCVKWRILFCKNPTMKTAFDSKPGSIFQKDNTLYQVLKWDYTRNLTGTIIRLRLQDIRTKHIIDRTFSGEDLFEDITLDRMTCEYLYAS